MFAPLFHGHQVGLIPRVLTASVDLAVRLRIDADVVGSERELPTRVGAINQCRSDQGLGESRPHQQKLRRGRVNDVNRRDATVAAILLGEEERLFVRVGREPATSECLAICECRHPRVSHPPCSGQVGRELRVERVRSLNKLGVIPFGGLEQVRGLCAISSPIRPQFLPEEFDCVEFVIGDDEVT